MHKDVLSSQTLLVHNRPKDIAFAGWVMLIAAYWWYSKANDLSRLRPRAA
jgi:hypothetical protein